MQQLKEITRMLKKHKTQLYVIYIIHFKYIEI